MWSTCEEDDIIYKAKKEKKIDEKQFEKNLEDKLLAEKIISMLELNKKIPKDDFMNKILKINYFKKFSEENSNRKLIWEIKRLLNICNIDVCHIRKQKTCNKIKTYVPTYEMIEMKT